MTLHDLSKRNKFMFLAMIVIALYLLCFDVVNIRHLSAVLLTFIIYATLAVTYYGYGITSTSILGLNCFPVTLSIWIGWALSLFVLQLIHFLIPLSAIVCILIILVGVLGAYPHIIAAYKCKINQKSCINLLFTIFVAAIPILYWTASFSMLPPDNYDSGLYHLNKIRWINSYPVMLGLGNVHGRLAFNQTFFEYVAALNFYPFLGHGRSIANSFLFLLTTATFIEGLHPVFKRSSLLFDSHPFEYISIIILFPALVYIAFFCASGLRSPSPDLTITLVQLIIMIIFVQGLGEFISGQTDQNNRSVFIVIMATTAVTIKLSSLMFSVVIIGLVLLYIITKPHNAYVFVCTFVLSAIMILVWCLQSVLLSGAPLYPSTIGYLSFDWSVPLESVKNEMISVYSFARQPGAPSERAVLENWNWFKPWLVRFSKNKDLVAPLILTVFFCTITLVISCSKSKKHNQYLEWVILLPAICAFFYWFLTAPDPRFATAYFLIIPMCAGVLFLAYIKNIVGVTTYSFAIIIVFILVNYQHVKYIVNERWMVKNISVSGWSPVKKVPLNVRITSSGLLVYTPVEGDQCWDSPLPSTPYFKAPLRLRNPDNVLSGFTVILNN